MPFLPRHFFRLPRHAPTLAENCIPGHGPRADGDYTVASSMGSTAPRNPFSFPGLTECSRSFPSSLFRTQIMSRHLYRLPPILHNLNNTSIEDFTSHWDLRSGRKSKRDHARVLHNYLQIRFARGAALVSPPQREAGPQTPDYLWNKARFSLPRQFWGGGGANDQNNRSLYRLTQIDEIQSLSLIIG